MNYIKFSIGIFIALAASRFVPHPPNFTSLMALSFYIPAILGKRYIPALIASFLITDLFIGFHNTTFFTWGSVLIIGLLSNYFKKNISSRIFGALLSCFIFFVITNFGVWTTGLYGYGFDSLMASYILAIPFFGNTIISTIIFSSIIEFLINVKNKVLKYNKNNYGT